MPTDQVSDGEDFVVERLDRSYGKGRTEILKISGVGRMTLYGRDITTPTAMAAFLDSACATRGPDITTNVTLAIANGDFYVANITANTVVVLGIAGPPLTGEIITIRRDDNTAFTLTIRDDAATDLIVLPASTPAIVSCRFNGTHFADPGVQRTQRVV